MVLGEGFFFFYCGGEKGERENIYYPEAPGKVQSREQRERDNMTRLGKGQGKNSRGGEGTE